MGLAARKLRMTPPAAGGGGGGITFPITGVSAAVPTVRSPSFTLGTAPAENDIIVVFVSSTSTATVADPSGWTNVSGSNAVVSPTDASMAAVMLYHRVTAGEAAASTVSWTLTNLWNNVELGTITVAVLRGVATSGELVGVGSASDPNVVSTFVIADVTPTASDCQIMAGVTGDGTQTQTTPSGYTLQAGQSTSQGNYLYSDDTLGSSGVATGTTNVTASGADEYVSIVACFAPA